MKFFLETLPKIYINKWLLYLLAYLDLIFRFMFGQSMVRLDTSSTYGNGPTFWFTVGKRFEK